MSDTVISVENVSKLYRIGAAEKRHESLVSELTSLVTAPFRKLRDLARLNTYHDAGDSDDTIWALKDVSFEVKRGEVLGIIGRNGAGKSTLLKILSQITEPTQGRIRIRGRVASLLEVGTGFHPELTGRDNVYLNGTILGMTKKEIDRKFDEIVDFSGVEKFLDTPIKRYSSGMKVRLAFAVAAHLEPEILVIDEVLAVGDVDFQKKCLNKMEDVSGQGRSILFVSHNMNAVTRLCPRALLLQNGKSINDGPAYQVTQVYLRSDMGTTAARQWPKLSAAPGNDIARLRTVRVRDLQGNTIEVADIRKPVAVEIVFDVLKEGYVLVPNHHFYNDQGQCVFIINAHNEPDWQHRPRPGGTFTSLVWIPGNFLAEGMLIISPALTTPEPQIIHFWEKEAIAFQVVDSHDGDSVRGKYVGTYPGVVRPMFRWETQFTPCSGKPIHLTNHSL
jgi:lipopolysaccharide transport system ATP-binding protein